MVGMANRKQIAREGRRTKDERKGNVNKGKDRRYRAERLGERRRSLWVCKVEAEVERAGGVR